jgi:hypothetical protein
MKAYWRKVSLILSAVVLTSCAAKPPQPMHLCNTETQTNIAPAILTKALTQAQSYSNEIYGSDCVVCAELFGDTPKAFTVHITSPSSPDMLLNTSATITVQKSDATVISRGQYHSCYVHSVRQAAPN